MSKEQNALLHVVILLLLLFLWPLGHVCVLEEASLLCRLPEEEFFSGSKDNKLINQAKMQNKILLLQLLKCENLL